MRTLKAPDQCGGFAALMLTVMIARKQFIAAIALLLTQLTVPPARADPADPKKAPPPAATEVWEPVPPPVSFSAGGVPSDAIVLFDGKNLDAWESTLHPGGPSNWLVQDGAMVVALPPKGNDIQTKQSFGDIQLHLEWREPEPAEGTGQHRGNSGVMFMGGRYELQILDSYDNPTYVNGQCGSVYKQYAPLVNSSKKPGEWQNYDVIFVAPRFSPQGMLLHAARETVFQNGVLVQYDVILRGSTTHVGYPAYYPHAEKLPLELQAHDGAVAFRNIWVRAIKIPNREP